MFKMGNAQAVASSDLSNKFNLKNTAVELVHKSSSEGAFMTIDALEAFRTQSVAIPASKFGLEAICGASCETAAQ